MEVSRVVCMCCGRVIRELGRADGLVSHGLCTRCAEEFVRQIEAMDPAVSAGGRTPSLAASALDPH